MLWEKSASVWPPSPAAGRNKRSTTMTLEERIGYQFKNKKYLRRALTHSSYSNESKEKPESNERMEFLGDAVLSLVVSNYIFHRFHLDEGDLTKIRASMVCEKSLFRFAQEVGLGEELLLGRGEEQMGGRTRPSIVSDAFEALIAAIFLDGGLEPAGKFVLRFVREELDTGERSAFVDYKTMLQEIVQKNPEEKVSYVLVGETGPDHDKHFVVEVRLNSNVIGRGESRSKKGAEQLAAKEALELMGR
ncbi:MAG: ribonuclease III [Angelakisella sp.]|nr:ribonuclease III [Angelakisella sp.]MCI9667463.1 ribonuclease III [Angelakisella sp.]